MQKNDRTQIIHTLSCRQGGKMVKGRRKGKKREMKKTASKEKRGKEIRAKEKKE